MKNRLRAETERPAGATATVQARTGRPSTRCDVFAVWLIIFLAFHELGFFSLLGEINLPTSKLTPRQTFLNGI